MRTWPMDGFEGKTAGRAAALAWGEPPDILDLRHLDV